MKKIILLLLIGVVVFLSGCSLDDIPFSVKNAEEFEATADEFEENITEFEDSFRELEMKDRLTKEDQKQLVLDIESIRSDIDEFINVDPPFGFNTVQKKVKKAVDKKMELLDKLQEKAEDNEATVNDVKEVNDKFFADISLHLFKW